jgi:hypothetical protein
MVKNTNYHCGIDAEKSVARKLKRAGAKKATLSAGSRTSGDVIADFGTRKLRVQVKATCVVGAKAKNVSEKETKRLITEAKANRQTPVIAKKENGRIKLTYAISGRDVKL